MSRKAVIANKDIVFDKKGRERTVGEIYNLFTKKMANRAKEFGVKETDYSFSGSANEQQSQNPPGNMVEAPADAATSAKSGPPGSAAVKAGATAVASAASSTPKAAATAPASTPASKSPMPGSATPAPKSAPAPAPAPVPTAAPSVRSAPGGFGGFQPDSRPTSQEIRAMDESNKPGLIQGLGDINRTLQESLGIHRNSHGVLIKILEKIQGSVPATPPGKTSPMPQASKEAPSVAVKMGRSE